MTAHTHTVITDGCYRCDLNKDEVRAAESDMLREAAALIRERAVAATPGPWVDDDSTPSSCVYSPSQDIFVTAPFDWDVSGTDTRHIASWHPAVAVAVADLLDVWIARDLLSSSGSLDDEKAAILSFARAYLGEDS